MIQSGHIIWGHTCRKSITRFLVALSILPLPLYFSFVILNRELNYNFPCHTSLSPLSDLFSLFSYLICFLFFLLDSYVQLKKKYEEHLLYCVFDFQSWSHFILVLPVWMNVFTLNPINEQMALAKHWWFQESFQLPYAIHCFNHTYPYPDVRFVCIWCLNGAVRWKLRSFFVVCSFGMISFR